MDLFVNANHVNPRSIEDVTKRCATFSKDSNTIKTDYFLNASMLSEKIYPICIFY